MYCFLLRCHVCIFIFLSWLQYVNKVNFTQKKQFKSCNVRTILNWLHSQKIWSLHGSKNTIAFKQANSVSSTWASRSVVVNSSMILQPIRLISISWDCRGIIKSFPNKRVSFKCTERRARPSNKCSPAWARNRATCKREKISVNCILKAKAELCDLKNVCKKIVIILMKLQVKGLNSTCGIHL